VEVSQEIFEFLPCSDDTTIEYWYDSFKSDGEITYFCDKDNFQATSKDELENHMKLKHCEDQSEQKTESYYCSECGLSFTKKYMLNKHQKVKHTVKERNFHCTFENCNKGRKINEI
jgi:hypothetical protein